MINVSRVVKNKKFTQMVTRIVSKETINNYGEAIQSTHTSSIPAIVTAPTNGDLVRYVDSTSYKKAICVSTSLILYPDNLTGQPDIFVWHDEHYVVTGVDDYRELGYTRAIACLTDYQSAPSNGNFIAESTTDRKGTCNV